MLGKKNLLLLSVVTVFCLFIAEVATRITLKNNLNIQVDERNLTYRHDNILGWFPVEASTKKFRGSRVIEVKHNSRGFRDEEPFVINNTPRIMFLGDSFVWGYDVERLERFTEQLKQKLPKWSIYNLGVSGYGTDQEYLLLQQQLKFYQPRIVFLVFCTDNDRGDNSSNERYGGYYKPYYFITDKGLELRGVPVPTSEKYFLVKHNVLAKSYLIRLIVTKFFKFVNPPHLSVEDPTNLIIDDMLQLSKRKNFKLIIGIQGKSSQLESFLRSRDIPHVNLSNTFRYKSHGGHWTPEGHRLVAEKIYSFLEEYGYL